jgi:Acetyltransferases
MLSVNVQNNIVVLKNIEQNQLESVRYWYNMGEYYRFATGIDTPVDIGMLETRFAKIEGNNCEFFLGIHSLHENRMIGVVNGRLNGNILWIKVLAIGLEFQGKKYGSISMELLIDFFKQYYNVSEVYLAVAERNTRGHKFWMTNGFIDLKHVNDKVLFDGNKYNVIIMQKRI